MLINVDRSFPQPFHKDLCDLIHPTYARFLDFHQVCNLPALAQSIVSTCSTGDWEHDHDKPTCNRKTPTISYDHTEYNLQWYLSVQSQPGRNLLWNLCFLQWEAVSLTLDRWHPALKKWREQISRSKNRCDYDSMDKPRVHLIHTVIISNPHLKKAPPHGTHQLLSSSKTSKSTHVQSTHDMAQIGL